MKHNVNITLWELSKLVNKKYKIRLSDQSIYNILSKYKITRKRLRSKYYPQKKEGQEVTDINEFYKNLLKFSYKKTISLDRHEVPYWTVPFRN